MGGALFLVQYSWFRVHDNPIACAVPETDSRKTWPFSAAPPAFQFTVGVTLFSPDQSILEYLYLPRRARLKGRNAGALRVSPSVPTGTGTNMWELRWARNGWNSSKPSSRIPSRIRIINAVPWLTLHVRPRNPSQLAPASTKCPFPNLHAAPTILSIVLPDGSVPLLLTEPRGARGHPGPILCIPHYSTRTPMRSADASELLRAQFPRLQYVDDHGTWRTLSADRGWFRPVLHYKTRAVAMQNVSISLIRQSTRQPLAYCLTVTGHQQKQAPTSPLCRTIHQKTTRRHSSFVFGLFVFVR